MILVHVIKHEKIEKMVLSRKVLAKKLFCFWPWTSDITEEKNERFRHFFDSGPVPNLQLFKKKSVFWADHMRKCFEFNVAAPQKKGLALPPKKRGALFEVT